MKTLVCALFILFFFYYFTVIGNYCFWDRRFPGWYKSRKRFLIALIPLASWIGSFLKKWNEIKEYE